MWLVVVIFLLSCVMLALQIDLLIDTMALERRLEALEHPKPPPSSDSKG